QARAGRRGPRLAADHRPLRRSAAARVRRTGQTAEPMIALLLLLQSGWTASPGQPTVGDTIRLERAIEAPAGWRLRAGKLPAGTVAEPLGDAAVFATSVPGAWVVRYFVVAWAPGDQALD